MKKKNQTFSKELKMPRLFREDLEAIENVIKEELKPKEYKLETKEYEYEKVESIPKDTKETTQFHIQTYSPYISIDFTGINAHIYAGDDDINAMGAIMKILNILLKKERKFLFWLKKYLLLPIVLIWSWDWPILSLISEWSDKIIKLFFLITIIVTILWFLIVFYTSMYRFSIINFSYSKEKLNFIKRNKDQIILSVIMAILGFILGIVSDISKIIVKYFLN